MNVASLLSLVLLDDASGAFSAGALFIAFLLIVVSLVIYWRIAAKMGYPGWYSLGLLVPLLNLILVLLVAFTEWPIERELTLLRGMAMRRSPS